jgi:hypothetical protein
VKWFKAVSQQQKEQDNSNSVIVTKYRVVQYIQFVCPSRPCQRSSINMRLRDVRSESAPQAMDTAHVMRMRMSVISHPPTSRIGRFSEVVPTQSKKKRGSRGTCVGRSFPSLYSSHHRAPSLEPPSPAHAPPKNEACSGSESAPRSHDRRKNIVLALQLQLNVFEPLS